MTDIKGYKPLSERQKILMNHVKTAEANALVIIRNLGLCSEPGDPRWLAIARTNLELGFMAAVRSIAQPETVEF